MNAQRDAFIREDYEDVIYREDPVIGWTIVHQGIGESPLGSGLLVMVAAGAGYAVLRRKRRNMSKYTPLILALVSLLGLTQCKKKLETISDNTHNSVYITLNVGDGSKVNVLPGFEDPETHEIYAKVTFENGDRIYVGNNGKYCGYLNYTSTGENTGYFSGTITPTSGDYENMDYLHFYFMGNKTPVVITDIKDKDKIIGYSVNEINLEVNETAVFSVNITDQTSKYPVISYGRSTVLYNSGTTAYTTRLLNKCAIVKFTTTDLLITNPITISGMNDKVTVDFAANIGATTGAPYSYDKMGVTDEGDITLHAESPSERWAILLPQSAVNNASASALGYFTTSAIKVPAIEANGYYATGTNLPVTVNLVTSEAGAFAVNSSNNQVFFAPGNLQVKTTDGWATKTWSFKTKQYGVDPSGSVGTNYASRDSVSHFGWGSSGWNNTANDPKAEFYQPNATTHAIYKDDTLVNYYHYGPSWKEGSPVAIIGTNYDWGVYHSNSGESIEKITNGGSENWRLLTMEEQKWIFGPNGTPKPGSNCRHSSTVNGVANARFVKVHLTDAYNGLGIISGVDHSGDGLNGIIIFPDGYIHPNDVPLPQKASINSTIASFSSNNYTKAHCDAMINAGAVFLPAAGSRWNGNISDINSQCFYWSSSVETTTSVYAKNLRIGNNDMYSDSRTQRLRGNCVRLVRDIPTSK